MFPPVAPATLAPHPILDDYYPTSGAKRAFVNQVFDRAAGNYDRVEKMMAMGTGRWYRRAALLRGGLARGMRVLDVAVGTGLVAREAIAVTGDAKLIVGLDPSPAMVRKAIEALGIRAILGMGEQIPLEDAQFDFVSMGYALRHLSDVEQAMAQFFRVLRPGGRLCVLEISRPRRRLHRLLLRIYMRYVVPLLTRLTARGRDSQLLWKYYWDTIESCIRPEIVVDCLTRCGFVDVRHRMELGMFSEYTAMRPAAANF